MPEILEIGYWKLSPELHFAVLFSIVFCCWSGDALQLLGGLSPYQEVELRRLSTLSRIEKAFARSLPLFRYLYPFLIHAWTFQRIIDLHFIILSFTFMKSNANLGSGYSNFSTHLHFCLFHSILALVRRLFFWVFCIFVSKWTISPPATWKVQ